ncbi:MAG: rRNA adenine methyltransferase [Crocinitomicaceae bacterium]|jgi:rifampin ADP-ribosylating transferase|nr:rRNA adenine methyltransferase [Crocinitomicaceae bacterium]
MIFDPENNINRLCAEGIALEGSDLQQAAALYLHAWNEAQTETEKATAAHYLARVQDDVAGKLDWDRKALDHGLQIGETAKTAFLPSLYLNVAKGLEDSGEISEAKLHYGLGLKYIGTLPENGYVQLIKGGLQRGLERTGEKPGFSPSGNP